MKIILLNGPPDSGKDHTGKILKSYLRNAHTFALADKIKTMVQAAFLTDELSNKNNSVAALLDPMFFEETKDKPCIHFLDKTLRELVIAFSNKFMKPLFGNTIWVGYLYKKIHDVRLFPLDHVIVTDLGFIEELEEFKRLFPHDNIHIIQLCRKGCSFEKDSRGYITFEEADKLDIPMIIMTNSGDESFNPNLKRRVDRLICEE